MRLWLLAAAGLVVIGLGVAGYAILGPGFAAKAQVQYLSATASVADVKAQVVATGTLQPARTFSLAFGGPAVVTAAAPSSASNGSNAVAGSGSSSLSWTVSSVKAVVGQEVKAGDVLATASTTEIDAQIAVATAQVTDAQTKVNNGGTKLQVANAKLALLNAKTNLANLEAERTHASLVAPEAGLVTSVNIAEGAGAPSGTAIAIASDAMVATALVTETDVSSIKASQVATVTITALGTDVTGTVSSVSITGSNSSGVVGFGILVAVDSVPVGVLPGMSVQVTVVTAQSPGVLSIPSIALGGTLGSYTVSVLAGDGTISTKSVGTGLITTDLAQITSGLVAGDRVVTGTASTQLTITDGGGGFRGPGGLGGGFGGVGN
ncbi:MAG: efflux RND transporter periplasmic adaptor subunit [Candidatus Limnocylindria bacterium]